MSTKLLIVESPAKAKTIEKFLGKDFKVKSSYGHIRDLDKGSKGIEIDKNFKPNYIISPEKIKVVKELKEAVKKVDEVWLATDEDREGEAISWHLCEVLGLSPTVVKRIVFREITKPAIQNAVKNPRKIDLDLVNAQQARRVLDRLVGFELSEILWKKVKNKLSAGRVQSVAVKLIVDREREIHDFQSERYFKVDGAFLKNESNSNVIQATLNNKFQNPKEAEDFLKLCSKSQFVISAVDVKPVKRNPAPPFTTSTLQQEASRKLGFGVNRTMSAAQKLYESGYISYMRTDSTSLSDTALKAMAEEIESQFGSRYVHTRQYKTKSSSAQEAHEAIRPTYMNLRIAGETSDQQKLYELIWKRSLASQMSPAELEKTVVKIDISETKISHFVAEGEVLLFDGFLKLYLESSDEESEEKEGILPPLKVGEKLKYSEINAIEKFTRPSARYTEASLVKKLEELGIGRPSTYAPTISKIMEEDRGYIVKESREGVKREYLQIKLTASSMTKNKLSEITGATKNVLYPTAIGMVVSDYLNTHFSDVINYGFTAEIEKDFDEIAEGKRDWIKMLDEFYWPFHKDVEKVLVEGERAKGRRDLGIDPASGRKLIAQLTRFGPVVQIGDVDELDEDEKPRYANLRPGQSLETISFQEALDLFQLPKNLGEFEGNDIIIAVGRFGPYIKFGEQFISIPKSVDPLGVNLKDAVQMIMAKRQEDAPIGYFKEMPITKGSGRFGPYVKWNGMFVNVPRRISIQTITTEEAIPLIEAKGVKEANRYIHQWPEEKITVENGRWGPYIKFGKKLINIPKVNDQRVSSEMAATMSLEDFKKLIEAQIPGAFEKKSRSSKSKETKVKSENSKKKVKPIVQPQEKVPSEIQIIKSSSKPTAKILYKPKADGLSNEVLVNKKDKKLKKPISNLDQSTLKIKALPQRSKSKVTKNISSKNSDELIRSTSKVDVKKTQAKKKDSLKIERVKNSTKSTKLSSAKQVKSKQKAKTDMKKPDLKKTTKILKDSNKIKKTTTKKEPSPSKKAASSGKKVGVKKNLATKKSTGSKAELTKKNAITKKKADSKKKADTKKKTDTKKSKASNKIKSEKSKRISGSKIKSGNTKKKLVKTKSSNK